MARTLFRCRAYQLSETHQRTRPGRPLSLPETAGGRRLCDTPEHAGPNEWALHSLCRDGATGFAARLFAGFWQSPAARVFVATVGLSAARPVRGRLR